MTPNTVPRVNDVDAKLAVPADQEVGISDGIDFIVDRLVDEQRHLRDAMVAHEAVIIDNVPDRRVVEDRGPVDEVVGENALVSVDDHFFIVGHFGHG